MGVLELHSANQVWDLVQRAKGSGPVGNRQPSIIACDQSASDDEQKCPTCQETSKPVEGPVVRCDDTFQKLLHTQKSSDSAAVRRASREDTALR